MPDQPSTIESMRPPESTLDSRSDVASSEPASRRHGWRFAKLTSTPWGRAGISVLSVVLFVIMWDLIARFIVNETVILPTPGAVVERFADLAFAREGELSLWPNLSASLLRVLSGWGIGLVVGVVLGVVMASSAVVRAALDPLLEAGRAIPPLALVPLLLVWFGIGETSKILLLAFAAVPVFAISTTAAITGVDKSLRRAALTLGAGRMYMIKHVILPGVLPEIFTAMRLASAFVWTTLVAAELVAATDGLGFMILQAGRYLDTPTIFVGIVTIGVVAFLMDTVLRALERYLVPWKGKA